MSVKTLMTGGVTLRTALIGYTGFVGSNLASFQDFTNLYNSRNIGEIAGKSYDLVVSAFGRADSHRINHHDAEDLAHSSLGRTPQALRRELLKKAYAGAVADKYSRISDDADPVAEYTGHRVKIVRSEDFNIKLTTRTDLLVADQIMAQTARKRHTDGPDGR